MAVPALVFLFTLFSVLHQNVMCYDCVQKKTVNVLKDILLQVFFPCILSSSVDIAFLISLSILFHVDQDEAYIYWPVIIIANLENWCIDYKFNAEIPKIYFM